MPDEDQVTTTPRRRSRRLEASDETRQPIADQASATETVTNGATAPAKPVRRRAAKSVDAAPQPSVAELPTHVEIVAPVTLDQPTAGAARAGGRGPRVSRPRASRGGVDSEAQTASAEATAPTQLEFSVEARPAADASTPPSRATRGRGRRAFTPGAETNTEITETASGVQVIRETPRTESAISGNVDHSASPSADAAAEQSPSPRTPYRFSRGRRVAPAPEGQANGAAQDATNSTPNGDEHAPAAPTDQAVESGDRPASSEGAPRPVRPLRRLWGGQENAEGREGSAYTGRDRATPHIPGGNDPYQQRRGADQNHPQGQQQRPTRAPGARPGFQRGQNPPAGQRGGAPYNPGAGGQNGQNGQDQRPGSQGYDRPYGQRGDIPPYAPYNPYEPYPGYPTGPQQGAPTDRPARGRGYPQQQQPGYPGAYPNYGEQRGNRGAGRTAGDYYTPNNPRDRRGFTERGDRRANTGRGVNRPGRERDAYGASAGSATPTYTPIEGRYANGNGRQTTPAVPAQTVDISGLLWLGGGSGMSPAELLDNRTLVSIGRMSVEDVRRMGLRSGDLIIGQAEERGGRRIVTTVETVNGQPPEEIRERPQFESLTASFPDRRIRLEHAPQPVSVRIIDLFAPLGFGSRALVVAPPKTGKTTLIREAAESVLTGYPDAVVMAVLVGERPEEVTDLRARLEPRGGLVYAASFDEDTQRHAWLVQVAVERAKRVAESGRDAFMVLDSLTRLARAENLATRGAGRTLSGGIDAQALDTGRRAFGAARNLEEGGSITILATCLVDTGSRQDEVVYEEFKGTGNMELHLSRELSQRRLFPAVDAIKSGTRREEMLLTPEELRASTALRRRLADLPTFSATDQLLKVMERTQSNSALLQAIEQSGWMTAAR